MEEQNIKSCDCGPECQCANGVDCKCAHEKKKRKKYFFFLVALGLILVAAVVIVSLLRERLVNPTQNQITVYGEGKVEYAPDIATVNLGVRVDKAATAADALTQMNDKIKKITDAVTALGIPMADIKTESYNLSPTYDYKDGVSSVSGYNASQNLDIKARGVDKNTELVNKIVAAAGDNGTNAVQGVNYAIENPNDLRQKARIAAIEDARSKAVALAEAAGIKKLGKVLSWYEDAPMTGGGNGYALSADSAQGFGGAAAPKAISTPQISSGTQDIVIDMAVNFEVK